jgi:hypothetical protein
MAPTGLETEVVELVLPHGRSVRRRRVEGYALPVAVAVSALADAEPTHPSGAAWQAVTRFALRLLADGRLHPALTPSGYDTWQVGPFTAAQRQTLDALTAAFPPHAHCLPEPGPAPVRIAEPAALIRQFCDAVADDLVRTPAAPLAMGALPYAWREARAVLTLREWAEETQAALTAEVSVSLRVDVPEGRRRQALPCPTARARPTRRSELSRRLPPLRSTAAADRARPYCSRKESAVPMFSLSVASGALAVSKPTTAKAAAYSRSAYPCCRQARRPVETEKQPRDRDLRI